MYYIVLIAEKSLKIGTNLFFINKEIINFYPKNMLESVLWPKYSKLISKR